MVTKPYEYSVGKPKPDKKRKCLRCGKKFPSMSAGNRLCNKCKARKSPGYQVYSVPS